MKDKDFYILKIAKMLKASSSDTVKAVYIALSRMQKGEPNGLQKKDCRNA